MLRSGVNTAHHFCECGQFLCLNGQLAHLTPMESTGTIPKSWAKHEHLTLTAKWRERSWIHWRKASIISIFSCFISKNSKYWTKQSSDSSIELLSKPFQGIVMPALLFTPAFGETLINQGACTIQIWTITLSNYWNTSWLFSMINASNCFCFLL